MARVNHKKVRQLLNQERNSITDKQFFVSRILAGHFADIAAAQSKRYGYNRRVNVRIVWEPKNPEGAHTDNSLIWINAATPLVKAKKNRQERYEMVCGLFAHELGHVLYTDFLAGQTHATKTMDGGWYPNFRTDSMWMRSRNTVSRAPSTRWPLHGSRIICTTSWRTASLKKR